MAERKVSRKMSRKMSIFALLMSGFLLLQPGLAAAESLSQLEQEVNAFVQGPQSRYAPETAARAQALLGAAMMAERRKNADQSRQDMQEASDTLASARRTAGDFVSKYKQLLEKGAAARGAVGNIPDSDFERAEKVMKELIGAFENGELNEAAEFADHAEQQFLAVLRTKLPALLEKTDNALLLARRAGGKRYAPVTYAAAQQWLNDALAFSDGVSKTWPRHPRLGLQLAEKARELGEQVKQWRKKPGSYEMLALKARDTRLRIARALGMTFEDNPVADVGVDEILARIKALRAGLATEKAHHAQEIATLKEQYAELLARKTEEIRNEMEAAQGKQLGEIKEAFRAKLERETFEIRRQKKLRALFKPGEVQIFANLDGSLLLRLSALQFPSGRTSISKKYFDLLSRVRQALDIYPERKVVIEGHTDNRGDPKANQLLSLKRAETVRDFLIAAGMDAGRLKALGYGEVRPVASNDYEKGRAMNRRIDIVIRKAP